MANPETTETTNATTTTSAGGGQTLTATESKAVKPGWQTTEFWLTFLASTLSMLYASDVIGPDDKSTTAKALAFLASALATLGYSVSRGSAKK